MCRHASAIFMNRDVKLSFQASGPFAGTTYVPAFDCSQIDHRSLLPRLHVPCTLGNRGTSQLIREGDVARRARAGA